MKKTSNAQRSTFNVQWGRPLVLVLLLDIVPPIRAEPSPRLETAIRPLAEGVPQVAVVRLRALLSATLSNEERRDATAKLGEALVAAEQSEEAVKVLSDPVVQDLPATKFLRAQALAALSRWTEALPLYQQSNDARSPFRSEALFGHAEAIRALGRLDEALLVLQVLERDPKWVVRARLRAAELLLQKQDEAGATRIIQSVAPTVAAQQKERRFLRGRSEARKNRDHAIELYESILKNPEGATHSVLVATLFALAEAHLQSRTAEAGDNFLEDFIERHPADPDLPAIFAKLDQLYAAQKKQSRQELARWSNDAAEPRRALAQWYLARNQLRLERRDLATQTFEQLRASHPTLPALAEGFLEFAHLEKAEGRFDRAITILEEARGLHPTPALLSRIEMLLASTHYAAGRFDAAAQNFRRIAEPASPIAQVALFNATLGWLQAGDVTQSEAANRDLKNSGADENVRGDLKFEQALMEVARGEKQATASLQTFLREFPRHPRASEAYVALAELDFHAAPPRLDGARQNLTRAAQNQPTLTATERADYLMIWLEDAAANPNEAKVIALATEFLQKYAASAFQSDVRLKLAEIYYRRQDFVSAQTQFEILAQRNPKAPIAEKALFFAAQSAAQTMGPQSLERALVLFDEVVKKNGELKWAARNEQAVIERKLGKPQDAATLYDEVLKGDAQPVEKREALCAKGDILYEAGTVDPNNYKRAIELYDQLANQADAPAHWRNQALFKKGMCQEKLKAPVDALATFYRIIEEEEKSERPREFFWYYKAGFNAARLLEADAKWQPAAAVYEKLAFAGGGRSEEAKSRLNRLRLEHFLWEQ